MTKHEMLTVLKEIRERATMEDAIFRIGSFEADITDLVRQVTRLWRDSWIIGPLDEMIADLEKGDVPHAV